MNSVITVWAQGSAADFERHVPLFWGGRRNKQLGSANDFKLIFLEGLNSLEPAYRESLAALGYTLIDASANYRVFESKYPQLNRFGDYEKKCFLRWLVLKDLFGNSPVIHYDGDIVFNATPEEIAAQLAHHVVVLQGCPAFVSTATSSWLQEYEANLCHFVRDVEGYSINAWQERIGWEASAIEKWSGSRYRKLISSDQDLISHLIHTDRLPQTSPSVIQSRTDLIFFENPLYFFVYIPDLLPVRYQRVGKVDYFNGRKIAFWHMQSDFVRYLAVCKARGLLNRICRCPNLDAQSGLEQFFWKTYLKYSTKTLDRSSIYQQFFEDRDLAQIFTERTFWKNMVFCG